MRQKVFVVHFQVPNLEVPARWRVGSSTFSPAGWLAEQIATAPHHPKADPEISAHLRRSAAEPLVGSKWATVAVAVRPEKESTDKATLNRSVLIARERARESIAAMRLLRDADTFADHSYSDFGLAGDVMAATDYHWISTLDGRQRRSGRARLGALAGWTFNMSDVKRWRSEPRYRMLDAALRAEPGTDWQRRVVAATTTWATQNEGDRPGVRIVLAATALETLLADPYQRARKSTGAFEIARRGSFLWCGVNPDLGRHGPERGACAYLISRSSKEYAALARRLGETQVCGWTAAIHGLFQDRNAAVHGSEIRFAERDARRHEFTVQQIIVQAIDWAVRSGGRDLPALLSEIDALPRSPAGLAVTT